MPTVPLTNRQVQQNALPNARVNVRMDPGAFGATEANSLVAGGKQAQALADQLAKQQEEIDNRKRRVDVSRKMVEAKAAARERIYDPDQGLMSRRGVNARDITSEGGKALDEIKKQALDGVTDPLLREEFEIRFATVYDTTLDSLSRHEGAQLRVAEDEAIKATVQSNIDTAAAAWNNPKAVQQSLANTVVTVNDAADRNGDDVETRNTKIAEAVSATHVSVIQAAVDNNAAYAKAYYEKNKQHIAGSKRDDVEKLLRTASVVETSQQTTDKIMATIADPKAQLAAARDIEDPDVRDATVKRVQARLAEQDSMQRRVDRETTQAAWQMAESEGSLDAMKPSERARVDPRVLVQIENYLDKRRKGQEPVTDWGLYYKYSTMSAKELASADLYVEIRPDMADTEFKQLVALQQAAEVALAKADKPGSKPAETATLTQQIADAVNANYKLLGGTDEAETRGLFAQRVRTEIDARGGPDAVDFAARQDIIDKLLLKGTVPGKVYGRNDARLFQAEAEGELEQFRVPYENIDETTRAGLEAAWTRKRPDTPFTDKDIENMYLKHIGLRGQ